MLKKHQQRAPVTMAWLLRADGAARLLGKPVPDVNAFHEVDGYSGENILLTGRRLARQGMQKARVCVGAGVR